MICFLVYDFNTPKKVRENHYKKYFLNLKSQQYFSQTGQTIFRKLYSIIEYEKLYQDICIQIIEELLKAKEYLIYDIETETTIKYVLKMENTYDSTEILKLLVFYWNIEENPDQFQKYKDILAQKSPLCELILNLKEGTKHTFKELFATYIDKMKVQYKGYPSLHKIMLQKDRKYLMKHKIFKRMYRSVANKNYIINAIPEVLELQDDFIFTIFSKNQEVIQDQIMNSSNKEDLDKIIKTTDNREIIFLLFARSQEKQENLLEQMLRKPDNIVNDLLQKLCSANEMETFYTEKMLLMVIILIIIYNKKCS